MQKYFVILLLLVALILGCSDDVPKSPIPSNQFVAVKGGTFQMGDTFGDGKAYEKPVHSVTVSSFEMSKYEVTNAQYAQFLNEYGSPTVKEGEYKEQAMIYEHEWGVKNVAGNWYAAKGYENYPVVNVTWYGANEFCKFYGYRLPTEAEWEYAARSGGKNEKWAGTSIEENLGDYAWYYENGDYKTHPVGKKDSNDLGLYDMSGNVWEWCSDWFESDFYQDCADYDIRNNPENEKESRSHTRVFRGGSFGWISYFVRLSYRGQDWPSYRERDCGFRVVRDID
jgi:formylglycine-generating enzyme required for sulfatase activity